MNKLEKITSIIILSAMPYILNAQTVSSKDYTASIPKELPKEELLARNTIYRSRTNYNYEHEEENIEGKVTQSIVLEETPPALEKTNFKIKYFDVSKLNNLANNEINANENTALLNSNIKKYFKMHDYIKNLSELENQTKHQDLSQGAINKKTCYYTYKKSKSLGHDYEYHLGKHTGICIEEELKFNDGKFHLENFSIKLVYRLGK